ncbi:Placental protein 11 [Harpegnathos saltator]|uniref:Placental protein 11 n=1 Tax=Harpegnathos saltator TaxID=610380 RepID=E2B8A4_HARSA|nr:Placental protein 11 [Harpegnathos saltator]
MWRYFSTSFCMKTFIYFLNSGGLRMTLAREKSVSLHAEEEAGEDRHEARRHGEEGVQEVVLDLVQILLDIEVHRVDTRDQILMEVHQVDTQDQGHLNLGVHQVSHHLRIVKIKIRANHSYKLKEEVLLDHVTQTNPTYSSSGHPSAPRSNTGTYSGSQAGKPGYTTENKQNSAPYNPYSPSAPSLDHISKSTVPHSQSHAPTSFGQPNAPFKPSHGTVPHNNPTWSNPHYNPSQSYPPIPASTNIGFKDHLRPTSMPVPSHVPSAPYPASNFNQRPPPYPVQSSAFNQPHFVAGQPHSAYNPGHPIGHPSSYPMHVPPPVPGTFGNPYATHPVGSAYGSTGPPHYPPQQHMLAQPAAQPYIPGQTVIMVPGQQDSGRGLGQIVKEALVFSTINAGVNRLLNPYPHHHYVSDSSRPASSSTTTSETHITYNNHYFNGAPTSDVPAMPPSPSSSNQGGVSYPANYPSPVNNPAITPGVSIPTIVGNNANVTNPANSSLSTTSTTNNMGGSPVVTPNGYSAGNTMNNQGTSDQWANMPHYRISDGELSTLTEELFALQEFNVSKHLTLHLQNIIKSPNVTDQAKEPLIHVHSDVYEYPTILAIRALYDNYEHNSTVKENRTGMKRKEEDLLLDVFLNTNVMARAMRWLSIRGFIDPDDFEKKDTLRRIWFNQFDGATSGFERVFASERYGYDLLGVQDWIYFEYQESKNRIDYKGYVDILKLGNNASLVKLNFQMDDIIRPNATIFVGTLPELEMSLYTICFFARPNDLCPVSLGGSKFNIYTHSFRYYGKDLIDLALPIF